MTENNLITIATAECFTHGKIAQEIHAFSRGYPLNYNWTISPLSFKLSLISGLFIPTISGVKKVLKIEPLPPIDAINDIKVYDQKGDKNMAMMMAEAVKTMTGAEIGIGTTAGIGKGGIAICNDEITLISSSDVDCDLRSDEPGLIMDRQKSGINTTLLMLESLLKQDLDYLTKKEEVVVINKI